MAALEAAGLVSGTPDPNDGRQTTLSLTAACRQKVKAGRAAREDDDPALISRKEERHASDHARPEDRPDRHRSAKRHPVVPLPAACSRPRPERSQTTNCRWGRKILLFNSDVPEIAMATPIRTLPLNALRSFDAAARHLSFAAAAADLGVTAFVEMERLLSEVANFDATTLQVSAMPTFASKWVAPRLSSFTLRHPQDRTGPGAA
jgi:hypothetical protein